MVSQIYKIQSEIFGDSFPLSQKFVGPKSKFCPNFGFSRARAEILYNPVEVFSLIHLGFDSCIYIMTPHTCASVTTPYNFLLAEAW